MVNLLTLSNLDMSSIHIEISFFFSLLNQTTSFSAILMSTLNLISNNCHVLTSSWMLTEITVCSYLLSINKWETLIYLNKLYYNFILYIHLADLFSLIGWYALLNTNHLKNKSFIYQQVTHDSCQVFPSKINISKI